MVSIQFGGFHVHRQVPYQREVRRDYNGMTTVLEKMDRQAARLRARGIAAETVSLRIPVAEGDQFIQGVATGIHAQQIALLNFLIEAFAVEMPDEKDLLAPEPTPKDQSAQAIRVAAEAALHNLLRYLANYVKPSEKAKTSDSYPPFQQMLADNQPISASPLIEALEQLMTDTKPPSGPLASFAWKRDHQALCNLIRPLQSQLTHHGNYQGAFIPPKHTGIVLAFVTPPQPEQASANDTTCQ